MKPKDRVWIRRLNLWGIIYQFHSEDQVSISTELGNDRIAFREDEFTLNSSEPLKLASLASGIRKV